MEMGDMKGLVLALAAAASALVLEGCVESAATGKQYFSLVGEAGERELGQSHAASAIKREGLYKPGSPTTTYVTQLCERMFSVTEGAANQPVSCILLDSETYNAWATPGYINVYRGFLPYVNSEAELAAVLGHESGHISAHHIGQAVTNQQLLGILVAAGGILAAEHMNDDTARAVTQLGGVGAGVAMASFSRSDEHEADGLGQRYLTKAGYDPREAVNMISAMQTYQTYAHQYLETVVGEPVGRDGLTKLFSSHPATPDRLANATKLGGPPDGGVRLPEGVTPATTPDDPQGRNRYLNAIDGLEVGPKVISGVSGRQHLTLPKAHTKLVMPDGFLMMYAEGSDKPENGTWMGRHPISGVGVKVQTLETVAGQNAGNVLLSHPNVDKSSISRIMLKAPEGKREAYSALGRNGNGYPQWFLAVSIPEANPPFEKEKGHVVVAWFTFPDANTQQREQPAIVQTLSQSEILTKAAAKAVKPLELDVRVATAGDSVANVAAKLPQGGMREEWFRALNNLPAGEMRVGQKYKTVIDPNL